MGSLHFAMPQSASLAHHPPATGSGAAREPGSATQVPSNAQLANDLPANNEVVTASFAPADTGVVKAALPPSSALFANEPVTDTTDVVHQVDSLSNVAGVNAAVLATAGQQKSAAMPIDDTSTTAANSIDGDDGVGQLQLIDLTTALLLTSGQNPQVAFAHARIQESLAGLDRAHVMKLPSIRAGVNYNKHEGRIQDVAGSIIETSRGSFYSGLGANAVGAGSPAVPGLISQFHIADAVFQPRIAQRTVSARRAAAQAITNDELLKTALAYVELLRAHQELAVAKEIAQRASQLENATKNYAQAGQGLTSDHDRARTELALRKNAVIRAEENIAVTSAQLAELVRWDCTQRLQPAEPNLVPLSLASVQVPVQDLVAIALANRPELAESRHLVCEAVERLNRERNAPLVPSVLLAASYGGLGGGLGGDLTNFGDRFDADAVAYWELRQFGLGDMESQREARSRISQARMREVAMMDRVAREVVQSHSQTTARSRQVETAREGIDAAQESFTRNWERIQNGQGLPIEVLQSIQALASAQSEYIRVVADHNLAQFTLHRSLGWPVTSAQATNTGK